MTIKDSKIYFCLIVFLCFSVLVFLVNRQPVPRVLSNIEQRNEAKLKIYFLDVGQGDAALIRTPAGDDILIDGGPDKTILEKLGEYLPFYDQKIELMILTHPHSDHVTGLVEALKKYQVDRILMTGALHSTPDYLMFLNLIKEKNILVEIIDVKREINLGGLKTQNSSATALGKKEMFIQILYPDKSFFGVRAENLNNTSIVGRIVYASTSVLLMGDFEEEENLLTQPPAGGLKADILKVGHHGSNDANSQEFLAAVSPTYAVISAGLNNQFGHPHYRTLKNLERLGVEILRTDDDGDVIFESDGRDWKVIR